MSISIRSNITLNDSFGIQSLEEVEEMDRQRSQPIKSLQISDSSVKCQKCGIDIPIAGKLTKPTKSSNRTKFSIVLDAKVIFTCVYTVVTCFYRCAFGEPLSPQALRQQAKENIKRYIDERLPEEYEKCLVGLNAITREAWNTAQNTEDKREKIQALSLAKECYSMKLDLLTNATVVDDAIRFVSSGKSKENLESSPNSSEDSKEESKEPDYDEDEDQLEEEPAELTSAVTTNQIF
jgi:hypothetical protein